MEIAETIGEQRELEAKRKWQRAHFIASAFADVGDFEELWQADETQAEDVTYDEAMEKVVEIEQKFRKADGVTKVNPYEDR